MSDVTVILADVYVAEEDADGEYWFEGEPARVAVMSQDGMIRIGAEVDDRDQEILGIYMPVSTARDFMVGLGAAIKAAEAEGV